MLNNLYFYPKTYIMKYLSVLILGLISLISIQQSKASGSEFFSIAFPDSVVLRDDPDTDSNEVWFRVVEMSPTDVGIFYLDKTVEEQLDTCVFLTLSEKEDFKKQVGLARNNYFVADTLRKNALRFLMQGNDFADRAQNEKENIKKLDFESKSKQAYEDSEATKVEAENLEKRADLMIAKMNEVLVKNEVKIQKMNNLFGDQNRSVKLKLVNLNEGKVVKVKEILLFDLAWAGIPVNEIQATNISTIQGLFFTVQIGVYSYDVKPVHLGYTKPIYVLPLKNGLMRYNSGIYDNVAIAEKAREIIMGWGVKDAWVTAYQDGIRITMEQALEIISKYKVNFAEDPYLNKMPIRVQDTKPFKYEKFKPQ